MCCRCRPHRQRKVHPWGGCCGPEGQDRESLYTGNCPTSDHFHFSASFHLVSINCLSANPNPPLQPGHFLSSLLLLPPQSLHLLHWSRTTTPSTFTGSHLNPESTILFLSPGGLGLRSPAFSISSSSLHISLHIPPPNSPFPLYSPSPRQRGRVCTESV